MKIKLARESSTLPYYATPGSAAFDLMADISEPMDLWPGEVKKVPTGLIMALPHGTAGLVLPRSGAALRGLVVANTPGLVDEDYRNEVMVLAKNAGENKIVINPTDRIAQMLVVPHVKVEFEQVDKLDETERTGGFGSTGM